MKVRGRFRRWELGGLVHCIMAMAKVDISWALERASWDTPPISILLNRGMTDGVLVRFLLES